MPSLHMLLLPRLRCLSLLQRGWMGIDQLEQIHAQLITGGLNCRTAPSVMGKLVERYCAISTPDGLDHARLIFHHTEEPNVFILNVVIRCMPPEKAIVLFADATTNKDLVFDSYTYVYALGACARSSSSALLEGKQIHARIVKGGFTSDLIVQTTGMHFYARNGDISSARQMFDEMPLRSSASWNAMIMGYCWQRTKTKDHAKEALVLFCNLLLDGCMVKPTEITIVGALLACSHLGVLELGSCVHGYIQKTIYVPEDDVFIGTGMIDMYSKCGCLTSAVSVFKSMSEKNVLTWTAMMAGLAMHGRGKEALELLGAMEAQGTRPNAVTFTCLLFACCHAGLVEEGLRLFHTMSRDFGITPQIQHYGCVVDLLGRAGRLQEAYEFIIQMPVKPDAILWRSLLAACRVHGNVAMGEKVGKLLLQLQPGLLNKSFSACEDYIALSNVYALAERWGDVEMVRDVMKVKGIKTKPSWAVVHSL
ncbi:PREDICTED: pentatricopeptide repeat-containing protein At3g18970 [Nelumbo nucifera]|uniref:Pentatricopeptide repeat-containing protein At3g18970 n=2 Tax=Nelumbo nucifera TaxID=4432 RepID=A0A822YR32_NELNU|nr:PREDICTED: pentatricopeptide repeat-containing protein At3g18970 [Nelumbo nucifera]DAD36654.1 TPA_asm: hypothetical protein HUJ06_007295 [Nelumbo nucifera]